MSRTLAAVLLLALPLGGCARPEATAPRTAQPAVEEAGPGVSPPESWGRRIAETACARCHALDAQTESPHPAAPPFPVLARRLQGDALMIRLEEGIRAAHPDMPEVRLAPREIDPFLAFWATL